MSEAARWRAVKLRSSRSSRGGGRFPSAMRRGCRCVLRPLSLMITRDVRWPGECLKRSEVEHGERRK